MRLGLAGGQRVLAFIGMVLIGLWTKHQRCAQDVQAIVGFETNHAAPTQWLAQSAPTHV